MRALAALLLMPIAWGGSATEAKARDAAARAIALIQSSQKGWYEHQNCVSCHHQFQPALAFRSAREHAIPVDEKLARDIAVHAFDYSDLDTLIQYNQEIEPAMTDAYQLVAADAAGVRPNLGTAIMARLLMSRQSADGHWDSFHQRPPSSYSRFTQTTLGLMAIQTYGHSSQHAASIDFGDSAMVEVLLQAGAKRETRNKEGLTAIELARKYGNSHLLTRLEGKP
jgi:hypothetical protein